MKTFKERISDADKEIEKKHKAFVKDYYQPLITEKKVEAMYYMRNKGIPSMDLGLKGRHSGLQLRSNGRFSNKEGKNVSVNNLPEIYKVELAFITGREVTIQEAARAAARGLESAFNKLLAETATPNTLQHQEHPASLG